MNPILEAVEALRVADHGARAARQAVEDARKAAEEARLLIIKRQNELNTVETVRNVAWAELELLIFPERRVDVKEKQ